MCMCVLATTILYYYNTHTIHTITRQRTSSTYYSISSSSNVTIIQYKINNIKKVMDTGLETLYKLLSCCWYSGQGPRWIGRRAEPKDGPIVPPTQTEKRESTILCAPSDLVAKACVGDIHALSPDKSLRYEILAEEHVEEVMLLLVHSFFREEPLGLAAGVRSPEHVRRWLPDFVRPVARQNSSTVCVEAESGRVVGLALCHMSTAKHDSPLMAALDPTRDNTMMVVAQFLADLHLGLQEENNALSLLVLNVERHFCGRGVAAELVRRTEVLAKTQGLQYVTADTTGEFSFKTFGRLGYHTVRELNYEEYPQLRPGPVHTTARVMLKKLE